MKIHFFKNIYLFSLVIFEITKLLLERGNNNLKEFLYFFISIVIKKKNKIIARNNKCDLLT